MLVAERGVGAADLHQPATGDGQVVEVVAGVEEGHRIGGAAGGAGHEDRQVFALELGFDPCAAMQQCARDGGGASFQCGGIGGEDEVACRWCLSKRAEQVGLGGYRQHCKVVEAADIGGIDAVVGELVGADRGLGFLINVGRGQYDTALVFVGVFTLVILALALYGSVLGLEKYFLRWREE